MPSGKVKWFDPKKNMPCICGVDKGFIQNVISPTYGDSEVPVRYDRVFTDDDFMDKANMGDVQEGTGTGREVETWKNAPSITLRGKSLKGHNFVDDTGS